MEASPQLRATVEAREMVAEGGLAARLVPLQAIQQVLKRFSRHGQSDIAIYSSVFWCKELVGALVTNKSERRPNQRPARKRSDLQNPPNQSDSSNGSGDPRIHMRHRRKSKIADKWSRSRPGLDSVRHPRAPLQGSEKSL